MLIVDAHQDLAWNMLTFGRDYSRSAAQTRQREAGSQTVRANGDTLLGWPDYQRGRVAVVFATLFAAPQRRKLGEWEKLVYEEPHQAHQHYSACLDAYHRLVDEHQDKFRLVETQADLQAVLSLWAPESSENGAGVGDASGAHNDQSAGAPVGLVVLMEGAEGVREPGELEVWWLRGLRLIGPAWAGNRFCGGTREPGPLTSEGFSLLEGMADWNFGLDLSHMDEEAALQALDSYPGQVVATHSNALSLLRGVQSNRHLTDRVIQGLLERDGVIGVVPYNCFLQPGWKIGDRREEASLAQVVAHIDYICQMAGDATHVGIGSDFDGGFGLQSTPPELDTIADLHKITPLLFEKGYSRTDIMAILGQNWLDRLNRILPESL